MSLELIEPVKWAAAASAVGTLTSAFLSFFAKRKQVIEAANERSQERNLKSEVRLYEIDSILSYEENRKSLYRYSSALLVFAQFVVGGVLASSFIAKNLNESIIGILGLIVLASSLVNQHFRPDLLYKVSVQKVFQLRTLKRWTEDQLYDATRGSVIDDDKVFQIRKKVSSMLAEIEQAELKFLEGGEKEHLKPSRTNSTPSE